MRDIFIKGKLADDMSLYVHRPSVTDPTVAPEGDDTFYVLSPVPHLGHTDPVDWAKEAEPYKAEGAGGARGSAPARARRSSRAVGDVHARDLPRPLSQPARVGLFHRAAHPASAWFRPHNVSEEARGLYLVGAGTHPGAGLPGVISSAEVLAQLVPEPAVAR